MLLKIEKTIKNNEIQSPNAICCNISIIIRPLYTATLLFSLSKGVSTYVLHTYYSKHERIIILYILTRTVDSGVLKMVTVVCPRITTVTFKNIVFSAITVHIIHQNHTSSRTKYSTGHTVREPCAKHMQIVRTRAYHYHYYSETCL